MLGWKCLCWLVAGVGAVCVAVGETCNLFVLLIFGDEVCLRDRFCDKLRSKSPC